MKKILAFILVVGMILGLGFAPNLSVSASEDDGTWFKDVPAGDLPRIP